MLLNSTVVQIQYFRPSPCYIRLLIRNVQYTRNTAMTPRCNVLTRPVGSMAIGLVPWWCAQSLAASARSDDYLYLDKVMRS